MRLLSLISGGKDSWYAFYLMLSQGFEIPLIITFLPKNKESYMFHYPYSNKVSLQIKNSSLKVKHYSFAISGEKEKEIEEMKKYIEKLIITYNIEGIICGAVKSEYQKQRLDFICEEIGIPLYSPLWHKEEETILREMINSTFNFLVVGTFAEGIEEWNNKIVHERNINAFIEDLKKARCNLIGEGGEYETFLTKSPFFDLNFLKIF